MKIRTPIIHNKYSIVMDYKPYSIEWSRKRYLAEAIQQYFDSDAPVETILGDLADVLEENVEQNRNRADKFEKLLKGLQI